jgi:hypothetical protein
VLWWLWRRVAPPHPPAGVDAPAVDETETR